MRPTLPELASDAALSGSFPAPTSVLPPGPPQSDQHSMLGARAVPHSAAFWAIRAFLAMAASGLCYGLPPFGLPRLPAAVAGFLFGILVVLLENLLLRRAQEKVLGGAIGAGAGILVALLTALLISRTSLIDSTRSSLDFLALFSFAYLGLMVGWTFGAPHMAALAAAASAEAPAAAELPAATEPLRPPLKLLDTSVLIDGRIADICEAHFMDGLLGVPQFVLRELQMVADSGDPLKRQRGRRGMEILQRMQKMKHVMVHILEDDATQEGEVDDKLIELARRTGGKIVTNDFNLNKVASLQGIAILNVNLLANAMKPAVLPGEPMRVLILREGKEPNQGVAYLDDGTMVVVDGARRMIHRSIDVIVTSVHQTTAGKMIFGRMDERCAASATPPAAPSVGAVKQAAAVASAGPNVTRVTTPLQPASDRSGNSRLSPGQPVSSATSGATPGATDPEAT
jgi:uncharacterized protein YacL